METNREQRRRNRKSKEKKLTYKMQANFLLAFGVVLVAMVLLIGVLVKINIKDGEKYAKRVLSQQSYPSSEIPFKRGDIVDRNNVVMATSIKKYDLAIDISFVLTQSENEYLYRNDVKEVLLKKLVFPERYAMVRKSARVPKKITKQERLQKIETENNVCSRLLLPGILPCRAGGSADSGAV